MWVSYFNNSSSAEALEENNYYPFGMNIPRETKAVFGTASMYNYKYNGKELQQSGLRVLLKLLEELKVLSGLE
ncbi:hypothetical protein [Chryseobacterium tongliaoense]|uniref:hypothetical protein n=1 Tax=Chryseobacterium tongliaoense TaxID=3240933 RepID=UPI0035168DA3